MSEESQSNSESPEESQGKPSLLDRLKKAAHKQDKANTKVTNTKNGIADKKEQLNRLQDEIRNDEAKLPKMILEQQSAGDLVNNLLLEMEKDLDLRVERIQPSGPVVQGGIAKFKAVHDDMPDEVELAWDAGGCPFVEDDEDTITVDTSPVGPGDYDISAFLVLAAAPAAAADPAATADPTTVKTGQGLAPKD